MKFTTRFKNYLRQNLNKEQFERLCILKNKLYSLPKPTQFIKNTLGLAPNENAIAFTLSGKFSFQKDYFKPSASKDKLKFLVTSVGNSGSVWLAQSLYMHPDILCTVGVDHPIDSYLRYNNPKDALAIYKLLVRNQMKDFGFHSLENELAQRLYKRIPACERDNPNFCLWIMDELRELTKIKDARLIGNIHGATIMLLHQNYPKITNINEFKLADLTRHPVTKRESCLNQQVIAYNASNDYQAKVAKCMVDYQIEIQWLTKQFKVDFDDIRNRCLFYMEREYQASIAFGNENKYYDIPKIYFERMRSDKDYFSWIVSYLSDNQLKCTDEYLDQVFSPQNLNKGRISNQTTKDITPKDQYEKWPDWEKYLFEDIVEKHDLKRAYLEIGYDLSFIKKPKFHA
ncbi:hypothetical protein [Rickettsiales endosymbiont of Stachyamoeba lipophora]|uniref:hypothetical protein n=1 Tax=Rickettsiales endosymbiont of Stachyamoeba lipophora TaxID=2486578 RepID=UPI000F64B38A|nr:hypothetical protein [Rickettsiales endosymbiont of Stachyamoeba lipophora]AZL16267.1 hypothetical protein EF513_06975 [Rickettsiales endosymbiont of Stachyamoeba lipophora]